jgi:hypothetical protein
MQSSSAVMADLLPGLSRNGFCFVAAPLMRSLLEQCGALDDWAQFAASWNDLEPDTYLAKVGRRRRRRYAVYEAIESEPIRRQPHQSHYQSIDYNRLQGNVDRWFAPMEESIGASLSLQAVLEFSRELFRRLAPEVGRWHIEVHQFRIEATPDAPGEPTPEGVHRDGVDYVLVLLIERRNIASGRTTIHSSEGEVLGSFTLTEVLDAALVDDGRVLHGVTSVRPLDPLRVAYRDVLVVTLRRQR